MSSDKSLFLFLLQHCTRKSAHFQIIPRYLSSEYYSQSPSFHFKQKTGVFVAPSKKKIASTSLICDVAAATVFPAPNLDPCSDFNEGHAASALTLAFCSNNAFFPDKYLGWLRPRLTRDSHAIQPQLSHYLLLSGLNPLQLQVWCRRMSCRSSGGMKVQQSHQSIFCKVEQADKLSVNITARACCES